VHALLGANGAGKTTLMRIAFGMLPPDAGDEDVFGESFRPSSPPDAIARGLWMVHQHFTLVPAMTVAENVALGFPGWRFDARLARQRVVDLGARTGLVLDPDARARDLPVGAQQRLEIVKAMVRDPRLLILDEPTAVLAPAEAVELMRVLRRFASDGRSVVLITHKLREALQIADDVTVLRQGRTVLAAPASELHEQDLATAMIGTTVVPDESVSARSVREVALRAGDLRVRDERGALHLRDVSLEVRRGEILGVVGVEGSGQRELLRALAGRTRLQGGHVEHPPRLGFVPEDRQREALVLPFSLVENVALRGASKASGRIRWRPLRARAAALVQRFDVRPPDVDAPAATLSGGNQQKLVLARELGDDPDIVIAENPTRGLDVAATVAVHGRLRLARDHGAAVVVSSSDIDEILALADRVIVLFAGQAREVPVDHGLIGAAMLGL
jgi:simple sugar transport system ATP-binding protein